ncbi:MAG: class I SAM-dependent methyltransferase [Gammaproteobacteria bacterium]|nr:class I SAM-dependent methyltransferase [Gammaproteobacteria bacterium]MDE2252252.1 class I SAM-dependent methyltransferase [Gammaproteobacteria bacterium]
MPVDHFSAVARQYAAFRPHYPAALYEWLAATAPRRERAWDCACGSGQATLDLAAHFSAVIGTDLSAGQLAQARPHERISYRVALAEQSGLDEASCDLVAVAQALHWFDLPRFYAEAWRVLRPGGLLAAWCYGIATIPPEAGDAQLRHYYRDVVGAYWPPERRLVEAGYRTLAFPAPEVAAPEFTMQLEWTLEELLGYASSWSATGLYIKACGMDPVPRLRAAMLPVWGDPATRRTVRWPLRVRAARR